MKIDITSLGGPSQVCNENRPEKSGGKAADKAAGSSSVVIGDLSSRLNALKADAGDQGVNRTRVEEIKQAIASGSITINPANIADGLLDSVQQMLGKGK